MHVVFLEVDTERDWSVASIGPSFIAAHLRELGHSVELVRASLDSADAQVAAQVAARRPGLVGLSLTTRQWLRGRSMAGLLRQISDIPVIAGGLHPTFSPEEVLTATGIDYVCLGEGEHAMADLADALERGADTTTIPNIWVAGGSRPQLRAPFAELDAMPFLARDLLDEPRGVAHIATQRGCPFPCTYCAARIYSELYDSVAEYGRRRSHDDVLAEMALLRERGQLAYAIFLDDTFTIQHRWVKEFCARYPEEVGVPFSLHARVETVNQSLLEQLAAAGCHMITYGVESGSERVRREVMRRPVSDDRFREVFAWTREAGIEVTANYMLGLPHETREELAMTVALAEELEVLDFGYFVFYPYPGTALYRVCEEEGLLPADHLERPANHRSSILTLPDLTPADIAAAYDALTDLRRRRYGDRDPAAGRAATDHVDELAARG